MVQRAQIEHILQLNGMSKTAPDEHIRALLSRARWSAEDIEQAITLLRTKTDTPQKNKVPDRHKVFHTDEKLSPDAIISLLGVEMTVHEKQLSAFGRQRRSTTAVPSVLQYIGIGLIVSALVVFALISYLQMDVLTFSSV